MGELEKELAEKRPPMPEELQEALPRMLWAFDLFPPPDGKACDAGCKCNPCIIRRAMVELGMEVPDDEASK